MKARLCALWIASAALVALNLSAAAADKDDKKGTVVKIGGMSSTTPADWKEEKAGGMRLQQFTLPRVEGDKTDGDVVIFKLGGEAKANIDRWKNQFTVAEGKKDDVKEQKMKVGDAEVIYLDVRGTYNSPKFDPKYQGMKMENFRLLGAIFETKDGQYQIRCIGPEKTIEKNKKGFEDWIKGFK